MSDSASPTAKMIEAATKSLSLLDKLGLIPMFNWRKHNMINAKELELELDKMQQAHNRSQEIEAAKVKITTMIAMEQANCRIEEAKKMIGNPDVTDEDIRNHFELTARAAASVCTDAIASQNAKERISLYALKEISENPEEKVTEDNPSETWMTRFMKYAGDMRDEDVLKLWGKILAGEIKKPGSFSLKSLEILYTLDKRDAETFSKLAPYVLGKRFIPDGAAEKSGIPFLDMMTLESIGLISRNKREIFRIRPMAYNCHYNISPEDMDHIYGTMEIQCTLLTHAGSEIYNMIPMTEAESKTGADFFSQIISNKYGIKMKIQTYNKG